MFLNQYFKYLTIHCRFFFTIKTVEPEYAMKKIERVDVTIIAKEIFAANAMQAKNK